MPAPEGNSIKKEPYDVMSVGSDEDDIYDLILNDKPKLSVKERLNKLKLRGITINQPGMLVLLYAVVSLIIQ